LYEIEPVLFENKIIEANHIGESKLRGSTNGCSIDWDLGVIYSLDSHSTLKCLVDSLINGGILTLLDQTLYQVMSANDPAYFHNLPRN
jgi:hypothetical protein